MASRGSFYGYFKHPVWSASDVGQVDRRIYKDFFFPFMQHLGPAITDVDLNRFSDRVRNTRPQGLAVRLSSLCPCDM